MDIVVLFVVRGDGKVPVDFRLHRLMEILQGQRQSRQVRFG